VNVYRKKFCSYRDQESECLGGCLDRETRCETCCDRMGCRGSQRKSLQLKKNPHKGPRVKQGERYIKTKIVRERVEIGRIKTVSLIASITGTEILTTHPT
jgi:hypothetical protein